jgi:hypothetical protein
MWLSRFGAIGMLAGGLCLPAQAATGAYAPAVGSSQAASPLVHKVHGDHRDCRRGYVREWGEVAWHRHRWNGEPAPCRRRDDDRDWRSGRDDDDDYGERNCVQVGPVRVCQ